MDYVYGYQSVLAMVFLCILCLLYAQLRSCSSLGLLAWFSVG